MDMVLLTVDLRYKLEVYLRFVDPYHLSLSHKNITLHLLKDNELQHLAHPSKTRKMTTFLNLMTSQSRDYDCSCRSSVRLLDQIQKLRQRPLLNYIEVSNSS